jgi:hypothetical protein
MTLFTIMGKEEVLLAPTTGCYFILLDYDEVLKVSFLAFVLLTVVKPPLAPTVTPFLLFCFSRAVHV